MAHAHTISAEQPKHMGLPLSNGKLAMWLFLVTEIMFFTGLIGTYIILRNGSRAWPSPHEVHLVEWMGALNTFVLICSSLTVVLAHSAIAQGDVKKTSMYIAVTLVLGCVFMGIKAVEYNAKFSHDILPGHIGDGLQGPAGIVYLDRVRGQLEEITKSKDDIKGKAECAGLLKKLPNLTPAALGKEVKELLEKHEDLHLTPAIDSGNIWASCYFAMTGFHACHVLGGLVIFVIILVLAMRNKLGVQHTSMIELTGLYWHFVDIVWIFLFPLLYLV